MTTGQLGTRPTHLPTTKEIRDLVGGLLGREISLQPGAPLAPGPNNPCSVAVYVDDRLVVRAVIACDLGFSTYAGAALALMPLPGAQAVLESGALDETLTENLSEVLNVAASLFNVADAAHVRLLEVHPAGAPLPPHVRLQTLTLGRREDLVIDVSGYGGGRLSVVIVQ